MDQPAPAAPLPPEAIQAEMLRLKLSEWRIELTAGRSVQPADPSDPNPLASEWKRYRKAEDEFWEHHAGKLPAASRHTVQTPVDFYWWLLGRVECLKQLCPDLIGPWHPGRRHPVPLDWINEACDLADRYRIPRGFAKPPEPPTPQQGLSIFDALLLETDKEILRRNGGMPWRGPLAIGAAAKQFDRLADTFDDQGRIAAKAAHLQADVNELATQAGRLLYQAIDGGAWRGQWPWAMRGRKPSRDLFVYRDDFSLIPSEQVTEVEQNPARYRDGERIRLPRPEVLPDEFIKPDRMAWAFWIAALNVAGQHPNAFRINPHRLDATDGEGDEADRLAFWRRRADVFCDACRFISTLLRQQPPLPDEQFVAPLPDLATRILHKADVPPRIELALPDAKELVEALDRYATARRRDVLLRAESPDNCWAIGENDKILLPLPYRIKQLSAALADVADVMGVKLIPLREGACDETVANIIIARDVANGLYAALEKVFNKAQQAARPDPGGARTAATGIYDEPSVNGDGSRRRGRLTKDESEAKRAHMLATIREHPSLIGDVPKLAGMIEVSKSTVYRWIEEEETEYRQSRAAQPAEDDEE